MKKTIIILTSAIMLSLTIYSINNIRVTQAASIGALQGAYNNLNDEINNIDYIKLLYNDGSYEEHWRDKSNSLERTDRYDSNGNFESRILVLDNGSKVINVGLENAKFEAYSWEMPNKIAKQNSSLLKESILKDVKESLKIKKWSLNGIKRNNNEILQKASLSNETNIQKYSSDNEDIYIDINSNMIKRMDVYQNEKLSRIEEYNNFKDTSKDLFKVNDKINNSTKEIDVPIKNINAPVASEDSVG